MKLLCGSLYLFSLTVWIIQDILCFSRTIWQNKKYFLLSLLVQSYKSARARTLVSNVVVDLAELLPCSSN